MKPAMLVVLSALVLVPGNAGAIIAIPPLEERVGQAEVIVVGTITRLKDDGGWIVGEVVVERSLKGVAKAGDKIPVRWKSPPAKDANPNLPQVADYTFRPDLDVRLIILLPPRKDASEPYLLNWGSTERLEDEAKIREALAAKP